MKGLKKRAFIELIVAFIIFMLAVIGGLYLYVSKEGSFSAFRESHRLKARLIAESGMEKALSLLKRAYGKGDYFWEYPQQTSVIFPSSEFEGKLADGYFKILKIAPATIETPKGELGPYKNKSYLVNGVKKGSYTLYGIEVEGKVRDVSVRLKSIVKVIRYEISY